MKPHGIFNFETGEYSVRESDLTAVKTAMAKMIADTDEKMLMYMLAKYDRPVLMKLFNQCVSALGMRVVSAIEPCYYCQNMQGEECTTPDPCEFLARFAGHPVVILPPDHAGG